jgi:hypothetical protein
MGIDFLTAATAEIVGYTQVHQIYLGSGRRGHPLWSFGAIDGGRMYEISGPSVVYMERVVASGKTARHMQKTRPHFQVPGSNRWHSAARMVEFAFLKLHGFAWVDITEVHAGYVPFGDDRMKSIPYSLPRKAEGVTDLDYESRLILCHGYGSAQSGISYDHEKIRHRRKLTSGGA